MPYSDWIKIISASVAPVVIISACGLLCLAFYNRLAAIVSRLRGFQRERMREQEQINGAKSDNSDSVRGMKLLELLETQTEQVMRRAKLIQLTLGCLLLAITMLIGCCLMLGLSILEPGTVFVAVGLFVLGLLTLMLGMFAALGELRLALQPAELESRFVSEMTSAIRD
jgi:hypothetical protein